MWSNEYTFYELMWFTPPFQKEFFAYFGTQEWLWWWVPMELSWAKPSNFLLQAQEVFQKRWWIRKWIPFVEQVCITGKVSFNAGDEWTRIGLCIITTRGRFRLWHVCTKIRLWCINIRLRYKRLPQFWISIVLNESQLSCLDLKDIAYDALLIYQLAHLSLRYQKFESMPRNLYTQNEWLSEYLPNFPSQFVIWLWQTKVFGTSRLTSQGEYILGMKWWWILERCTKHISLFFLLILKKLGKFQGRTYSQLLWRDEREKSRISLQWKLLTKEEKKA